MNVYVNYILSGLAFLPKGALAAIARAALHAVEAKVEADTTNPAVKALEESAFAAVDSYLAQFEASNPTSQ